MVTGSQGFVGRHVVRDLRRRGVQVTTLGRQAASAPSHIAMGEAPWSVSRVANVIGSVQPDVIFHLAGTAVGSPEHLERLNVGLADTIMEAMLTSGVMPLLVCCGSAAEYGAALVDGVPTAETVACQPVSAYAASKHAQTKAALAFAEATGASVLVARIFNPIGSGMPAHLALGDFARQIAATRAEPGVIRTGNLDVDRDFIDVDDVAAALWILANNPGARGVVNVCSGAATELRALVRMLIAASGKDIGIEADASRLRSGEVRSVIGSTARLAGFGAAPARTDYADAVARLWHDAMTRAA